jgi:hypothetical protein
MANPQTSSGVALAQEDLRKDEVGRLMALSVTVPSACSPLNAHLNCVGSEDSIKSLAFA